MDLGSRPLGDVLDVAAVAALHEEVVLGSDVQVGGDRDGAGQAAGQVLQQQSGAPLGRRRHGAGQRNRTGSSLQVLVCCGVALVGENSQHGDKEIGRRLLCSIRLEQSPLY